MIKHVITIYNDKLPEILATIDATCFNTDKMSKEEWLLFFKNHKSWLVIWYELENKPIAAAVTCWVEQAYMAYFYSNAVLPEYQRQGLGSSLIEDRIKYLSSISITKIQAGTRIDNTASIKSLLKQNFIAIQYVPDLYGDCKDGILWELQLS
jgi:ribosomal protein S18 acetylase RimI-like enzyme